MGCDQLEKPLRLFYWIFRLDYSSGNGNAGDARPHQIRNIFFGDASDCIYRQHDAFIGTFPHNMLITVQSHAEMLCQKQIIRVLLFAVTSADFGHVAPFCGTMFHASSIISFLGFINTNA